MLADPDAVADLTYDEALEDFDAAEAFGTVADEAYEDLTGEGVGDAEDILEPTGPPSGAPSLGDPADPENAAAYRARFPRLAAAYYA